MWLQREALQGLLLLFLPNGQPISPWLPGASFAILTQTEETTARYTHAPTQSCEQIQVMLPTRSGYRYVALATNSMCEQIIALVAHRWRYRIPACHHACRQLSLHIFRPEQPHHLFDLALYRLQHAHHQRPFRSDFGSNLHVTPPKSRCFICTRCMDAHHPQCVACLCHPALPNSCPTECIKLQTRIVGFM